MAASHFDARELPMTRAVRVVVSMMSLPFFLAACSRGASGAASTAPTAAGSPSPPPATPTPALPTPTGGGFCQDRAYVLAVADMVRAGEEPWRHVAAYITATRRIVRADAASAPTPLAAFKIRQLAVVLDTMGLAVKGSVENYPDDTASQGWARDLPGRVQEVSASDRCSP